MRRARRGRHFRGGDNSCARATPAPAAGTAAARTAAATRARRAPNGRAEIPPKIRFACVFEGRLLERGPPEGARCDGPAAGAIFEEPCLLPKQPWGRSFRSGEARVQKIRPLPGPARV
jgi:hypothetical protein